MIEKKLPQNKVKPFLRWTGSKSWLVKQNFFNLIPRKFNNYHECFLGGGSVFFALENENQSFLYDSNPELIETYIQIRDNLDQVVEHLKKLKNTEKDYYNIRDHHYESPCARAARFIYLNRCSFNGIYRVNKNGIYNVPYGKRSNVDILTRDNLSLVKERLQGTKILETDFAESLKYISEGDFVFLDPPYTVAHEHNGFIEYNQKLFSWEDQERLRDFLIEITNKGAYFILTNASHHSILNLYDSIGQIRKVSRHSQVGGRNKTRGTYNELIIYNNTLK